MGGALKGSGGLITRPPFRSPHHTSSDVALVGGGTIPSVGEVSLAHNGVLFLDEFVEFRNNVIQALRQPLEDYEITVSRAMGTFRFPADFMLVAASNPCRCGYLFDGEIPCTCPAHQVKGYFQKITGPILDRIDIEVLVGRVPCGDLLGGNGREGSAEIKKRVMAARDLQARRFDGSATRYNSRMTQEEIREALPPGYGRGAGAGERGQADQYHGPDLFQDLKNRPHHCGPGGLGLHREGACA